MAIIELPEKIFDDQNPLTVLRQRAPLFPVACGLILGIVLDQYVRPSPFLYPVCFLLVVLLLLVRKFASIGLLIVFIASLCVGGLLHYQDVRLIPQDRIDRFTLDTDRIVRLRGTVASPPRVLKPPENPFARWSYGRDRTVFLLDVRSIDGADRQIPVSGRVRVTISEPLRGIEENDRVEVFGVLYRFSGPRNPGAYDWRTHSRRQGVVAGIRGDHADSVRRLSAGRTGWIAGLITRLRARARGMLTGDLAVGAEPEASLLEAMVLGHRSQLDRQLNEIFIRAGCVHFLAVSGIHVVIVMFFARVLAAGLFLAPRGRTLLMLITVVLYVAIAEPRPPILRAGTIAVTYCIARLMGRERTCLNWIAVSAILLAVVDPAMVFGIGYQLSFAAVLGVSYLNPALNKAAGDLVSRLRNRPGPGVALENSVNDVAPFPLNNSPAARLKRAADGFVRRRILVALYVTFAAWLATLPIVALIFQRIQPWGPINSAILLFPITILMGLGFFKMIVSPFAILSDSLAGPLLHTAESLLIVVVDRMAGLPGSSLRVPSPPAWWIVLYYLLLIVFVWRFPRDRLFPPVARESTSPRQSSRLAPPRGLCTALLVAVLIGAAAWVVPRSSSNQLIVNVLAVGNGLAMVIELPDGRTLLYDAGTSNPYDVGRSTIVPFLLHRNIRSIDGIIISHPNLDHFSGVPSILDEFPTGPILVNAYFEPRSRPGSPSRHLLDILAARDHAVETMDEQDLRRIAGEVAIQPLWPVSADDPALEANDSSSVLRLSYAGYSILLTGDIEDFAQEALMARGGIESDVLILPHHGSVRASSKAFIEAVGADHLIRSSAQDMAETRTGLDELAGSISIFNTADLGWIRIVIDQSGIEVSAMNPDR